MQQQKIATLSALRRFLKESEQCRCALPPSLSAQINKTLLEEGWAVHAVSDGYGEVSGTLFAADRVQIHFVDMEFQPSSRLRASSMLSSVPLPTRACVLIRPYATDWEFRVLLMVGDNISGEYLSEFRPEARLQLWQKVAPLAQKVVDENERQKVETIAQFAALAQKMSGEHETPPPAEVDITAPDAQQEKGPCAMPCPPLVAPVSATARPDPKYMPGDVNGIPNSGEDCHHLFFTKEKNIKYACKTFFKGDLASLGEALASLAARVTHLEDVFKLGDWPATIRALWDVADAAADVDGITGDRDMENRWAFLMTDFATYLTEVFYYHACRVFGGGKVFDKFLHLGGHVYDGIEFRETFNVSLRPSLKTADGTSIPMTHIILRDPEALARAFMFLRDHAPSQRDASSDAYLTFVADLWKEMHDMFDSAD